MHTHVSPDGLLYRILLIDMWCILLTYFLYSAKLPYLCYTLYISCWISDLTKPARLCQRQSAPHDWALRWGTLTRFSKFRSKGLWDCDWPPDLPCLVPYQGMARRKLKHFSKRCRADLTMRRSSRACYQSRVLRWFVTRLLSYNKTPPSTNPG